MTAYEKYQLQWMIDHGCSLADLIKELTEMQTGDPEDEERISTPVSELFSEWEECFGFDGMIYACKAEWEDNEAKEEPFGCVQWCNEDIANALKDAGLKATDEAILFVRDLCENDDLINDRMCEAGWNVIENYIHENEDNFEEE